MDIYTLLEPYLYYCRGTGGTGPSGEEIVPRQKRNRLVLVGLGKGRCGCVGVLVTVRVTGEWIPFTFHWEVSTKGSEGTFYRGKIQSNSY